MSLSAASLAAAQGPEPQPVPNIGSDRAALRPTRRAVLVFALGIPLAFLMLAWSRTLWPVSFTYALFALALIAADALLIVRRRTMEVGIVVPHRLAIGEAGQVRVDVAIPPGPRPARLTMVLEQTSPADLPEPTRAATQAGHLAIGLPLAGLRRGRIGVEAIWLRWPGPLGLVECRWRKPLGLVVDVVPVIRGLRGAALDLAMDTRHGSKVRRDRGEGSEFETLREHVAGLDNRHIDWKHSARHTKLLSKVFRTERNHQIVLAFDTGHLMLEPIDGKTRLDHAIEAGLLLGWVALKSDDLVGAFGFDSKVRQFVGPAGGLRHLARVQQAVARLDYATDETNFTLGLAALNQRLRRRALVVLFTEFVDTVTAELLLESMRRIANRHAVIFVTLRDPLMRRLIEAEPTDFLPIARCVVAHDLLRDRAIVLECVARMGVHVLDVEIGGLTGGLVNTYLEMKQRDQL